LNAGTVVIELRTSEIRLIVDLDLCILEDRVAKHC